MTFLYCFIIIYTYRVAMAMNIPHIIHQIWFQGESKIPDKYNKMYKSCLEINKNYKRILWDSNKIENFLQQKYPKYLKIYNKFPLMIQKIDFAKYAILYHYGGIYVDMDVMCLKNIDGLINMNKKSEIILSKLPYTETLNKLLNIYINYVSKYLYKYHDKLINNGIIMTISKHNYFIYLIEHISKVINKNINYSLYNKEAFVCVTTGPTIFSYCLKEYKKKYKNKITILPYKYMEPCIEVQKCDLKYAYFNHIHQRTWGSRGFELIVKMLHVIYKIKENKLKYSLILICIIFLIFLIKKKKILK